MGGKHGTPVERFERHYIPEPNSGCWLWTGSINKFGYGQLGMLGSVPVRAHVFSYKTFKGTIKKGLDVRHTCDVRCCVNPDHLLTGTRKQNMQDAADRGRIAKGFKLPHTKFTPEQRQSIINDLRPHKLIAAEFGCHTAYVSALKTKVGIKSIRDLSSYSRKPRPDIQGEKHPQAKLSKKQVLLIKQLYSKGVKQVKLAKRFSISQAQISRIILGQSYA